MTDGTTPVPGIDKKLEIRNLLLSRIESGEWPSGVKLPGARQLAKEVGCSFIYLQSVLESLVQQCILLSVPRNGTYVRENWQKRLLHGTLGFYENPRGSFEKVYIEPLRQAHPGIYISLKLKQPVYEIQVSHHVVKTHRDYMDLLPCFRKLFGKQEDAFYPAPFAPYLIDGKLCGLPLVFSPRIYCCNKRLFRECGVPLPKPNWSWRDFLTTIRELRKTLPPERVLHAGRALSEIYPLLARFHAEFFARGKFIIDSPQMVVAIDNLLDLRELLDNRLSGSCPVGEAALWQASRQDFFSKLTPEEQAESICVELPLPSGGRDVNVHAMELFCARKECADQLELERLMKFFYSPTMQMHLGKLRYGIPVLKEAAAASIDPGDPNDALILREMGKESIHCNLDDPEIYNIIDRSILMLSKTPREDIARKISELAVTLRYLNELV